MDQEALQRFAEQIDADTDEVVERWEGRPDLIIDDIFRVRDIDTGEVRDLELFDVQRKVVHAYFYGDSGTLNLYKGRRIGYSFVICTCFLLEGMFYPDSFYPLVSRSLGQAKNRISDIQNLIDHAKVEIPTQKDNTDYIQLWNETGFKAYSADADTSRGDESARAVLMDEMAFIEDEEQAHRAFGAFLVLGQDRKMVEVSTPNTKNDLFMREHRRGGLPPEEGVLSIKQPTFENAEEIDIHTSLYEQEVVPVRPDFNIDYAETQRMADPEGFGQEFLCRPVVDEYRFFSEDAVNEAMARSRADDYYTGIQAPKQTNIRRIMGIDVAAGVEGGDDTVISVTDHKNNRREQRFVAPIDRELLVDAGVTNPRIDDVLHQAQAIAYIYRQLECDAAILDKGGVGQTFQRQIERQLGREVVPFDFSDTESVNDMFEDSNACLHQGEAVLVDSERLFDEMTSIVKQKKEDWSVPHYSGKDNSASGKDDMAMATVLSLFPPHLRYDAARRPAEKKQQTNEDRRLRKKQDNTAELEPAHGAGSVSRASRSRRKRRKARHARYR